MLISLVLISCASAPEEPGAATADTGAVTPPAPVVELVPEEEDVYTTMSEAILLGNVDDAIAAFEKAYSEDPEDPETKTLYANLLMIAGKLEEARLILQEVLEAEPGNTDALYNLALIEGSAGDRVRQEEILKRITKIDPEHSRAHASLGELRLAAGEYGPARESFGKALASDPDNIVALMGYGNVLLHDGEAEEAEQQFDRVIAQVPDYVFAYVDRSRAKRDIGDYRGAEEDLTEAVRLDPDYYWHYIDRGRVRLIQMSDVSGALEDFNRAIEIDSDYFYAYIFRGGVLDQTGDNAGAVKDYLKVLEARPDYSYLYGPTGVLLYAEERYREARKYLRMAYEYEKGEHFWAYLIVLSYKKEGLDADLETYLKRAIIGFPRESLYYKLARLFLESGSDGYVTAEVSREEDLDLKLKALFILGTYYLIEEMPILAQKYFLEVEDKAPPSSFERRLSSVELSQFRGKGGEN